MVTSTSQTPDLLLLARKACLCGYLAAKQTAAKQTAAKQAGKLNLYFIEHTASVLMDTPVTMLLPVVHDYLAMPEPLCEEADMYARMWSTFSTETFPGTIESYEGTHTPPDPRALARFKADLASL